MALSATASTSCTATAVDSSASAFSIVDRQARQVAEENTATSHGASGRTNSARSTWVGTAQLGPWLGGDGRRDRSPHATPTATAATTTATTSASTDPSLADRPGGHHLSPRSSRRLRGAGGRDQTGRERHAHRRRQAT